jgi:hypothetical protein
MSTIDSHIPPPPPGNRKKYHWDKMVPDRDSIIVSNWSAAIASFNYWRSTSPDYAHLRLSRRKQSDGTHRLWLVSTDDI